MWNVADTTKPILEALAGRRPERTPVWFMRQAGRSLPEYREARGDTAMLEACLTPELAAELTLQPVRRYGVDAAIFYSDIMTPLKLAGVGVEIARGRGPVFDSPVRTASDVRDLLAHKVEDWSLIEQAASIVARELEGSSTTLLGFAGAPFTLASYIIQGGPSKDHLAARSFMRAEPEAWAELASWCADISAGFLAAQVRGGAQGVQLFDSWAGSLAPAVYEDHALPYSARALQALAGTPRIHFAVGAAHLLELMARPADALGIDWRIGLSEAAARVPGKPLQGNLDPAVLFLEDDAVAAEVRAVLDAGAAAPAHIFNLGHGVPPNADPAKLQHVVDLVHEGKAE